MNENLSNTNAIMQPQVYNPSEILNIFSDFLAKQGTSSKVIFLRGIYFKINYDPKWKCAYDILRDELVQKEITVVVPISIREGLKDGALVQLGGNIKRQLKDNGTIQLQLLVTRAEVVQDQAMSGDDIRRSEIRNQKSRNGYKNVDFILEDKLFRGERPRVALIFATTSITMADFNAGKDSASSNIDFIEYRVSFSSSQDLSNLLKKIDANGAFDAIALIRGGGTGIESLDDIVVLESVLNMKTPVICAVGHVEEKIFLKNIADKVVSTPNGLGKYFSDLVESVIQKRTNSRAALVEEVRKQYVKQIETAERQNKTLQEQIEKMTKSSAEAQANFKAQSESMSKQLVELQESLKTIQKTNADQAKTFNDNLSALQKTNADLQCALGNATAQANKALSDLTVASARNKDFEKLLQNSEKKSKVLIALSIVLVIVLIIVIGS